MVRSRRGEFEDQRVAAFSLVGGDINLDISCYDHETEKTTPVSVVFTNVHDIKNSVASDLEIKMVRDIGEIIHFEANDHHMLLIVVWSSAGLKPQTEVYNFDFDDMVVKS
ncbi:MAG: hypothetical protein P4M15_13555 [Alphaproteobacteria bacterium]|nr:hypothetical protein [Alphaproteobacteria bacterium]